MRSTGGTAPLVTWVLLAVTAYGFDLISITALMPKVLDDLGGDELYGAVFSASMLGSMVSLVVSGHLSDRFGPVYPGVIAPTCLAAGLLGVAAAPSMGAVVVARALSGFGGGGILSTAYVVATRGFPAARRARLFAIAGSGWTVPSLVAPLVAATVSDAWGWRWALVLIVPVAVVVAGLAGPILRRLSRAGVDPGSLRSAVPAVVLASGAALLLLGTGPAGDRVGPWRFALIGLGAVVGLVSLRRLMPEGTLAARPGLPAAVASRGLLAMAFMATNAFMPLALVRFRGASVIAAGTVLTVAALFWTAGSFLQAHLSQAWQPRTLARLGFAFVGASIIASSAVIRSDLSILVVYGAWALGGTGMGFAYNTLSVYAMGVAPAGYEGRTAAPLQLADPIGVALGTGIGGAILATDAGFSGLWTMMAVVAALGALAVTGLGEAHLSSSARVSGT